MNRIGVMHITDTLGMGGYERVAVNIVNLLPHNQYVAHLCTTRQGGPLADYVMEHMSRLDLNRQTRFDVGALRRLITFIRTHNIRILHAHGCSLFIASVASGFLPHVRVIWHDHYGEHATKPRQAWLYRLVAGRISGIIAVNQSLAEWSKEKLRIPAERIWYIPNFVTSAQDIKKAPGLPSTAGLRIVCVANFRAQKDHLTLVRAMALVIKELPAAHLLLVGAGYEQAYFNGVRNEIMLLGLRQNISLLENRKDVPAILRECDIGVLSSVSEGLPLALLEYGMAGLPVIVTNVGQCAEVLDNGQVGILVPPSSPERLAEALLFLLRSPDRRSALGKMFHCRVKEFYSPKAVVNQVCHVYETVLSSRQ
jgi:glycosyltransferase involved in cell wall biosynthesis